MRPFDDRVIYYYHKLLIVTTLFCSNHIFAQIAAVRRVVSTYSNDEIVLVLQHHDEDVEKTIADFVEGLLNSLVM